MSNILSQQKNTNFPHIQKSKKNLFLNRGKFAFKTFMINALYSSVILMCFNACYFAFLNFQFGSKVNLLIEIFWFKLWSEALATIIFSSALYSILYLFEPINNTAMCVQGMKAPIITSYFNHLEVEIDNNNIEKAKKDFVKKAGLTNENSDFILFLNKITDKDIGVINKEAMTDSVRKLINNNQRNANDLSDSVFKGKSHNFQKLKQLKIEKSDSLDDKKAKSIMNYIRKNHEMYRYFNANDPAFKLNNEHFLYFVLTSIVTSAYSDDEKCIKNFKKMINIENIQKYDPRNQEKTITEDDVKNNYKKSYNGKVPNQYEHFYNIQRNQTSTLIRSTLNSNSGLFKNFLAPIIGQCRKGGSKISRTVQVAIILPGLFLFSNEFQKIFLNFYGVENKKIIMISNAYKSFFIALTLLLSSIAYYIIFEQRIDKLAHDFVLNEAENILSNAENIFGIDPREEKKLYMMQEGSAFNLHFNKTDKDAIINNFFKANEIKNENQPKDHLELSGTFLSLLTTSLFEIDQSVNQKKL